VGLRYPQRAISQWRAVLESEGKLVLKLTESMGIVVPHPLHMSVVDAVVSLFLRAVEFPHRLRPIYEQAIEGLAAWAEDDARDQDSQQAGLPLFLALAAIGMPPDDGSGDPETWSPAMLYVAGTQPESAYRRNLANLIRRAIRDKDLRHHALETMKKWIAISDGDPWLADVLESLLQELLQLCGQSVREHDILSAYLMRLAAHPAKPSPTAQRLLQHLSFNRVS